jgi:hypothetical protein
MTHVPVWVEKATSVEGAGGKYSRTATLLKTPTCPNYHPSGLRRGLANAFTGS